MTDEIERVREAVKEAAEAVAFQPGILHPDFLIALAKLLQPKPTPAPKVQEPKVWSVSDATGVAAMRAYLEALSLPERCSVNGDSPLAWRKALNAIVDDILRDRPDASARDWERRYRKAFPEASPGDVADWRRDLFPEVEG